MNTDEVIRMAADHFSVTKDGELSRDSVPFSNKYQKAKLGVRFDTLSVGCKSFSYRVKSKSKSYTIKSHRMVYYLANGCLPNEIDHIDGDPTNNHPSNLREATHKQNMRNVRSHKNSSSKYLGVCWHKNANKWVAGIKLNGKRLNLGSFMEEKEAASMYNLAAIEYFGEFANLNIIK